MGSFSLIKEGVFHAENEDPPDDGILGTLVALARFGRRVAPFACEYGPCAQMIDDWVKQADADDGVREDQLTRDELEELRHLRPEVKQLREEWGILSKGCPLMADKVSSQRKPDSFIHPSDQGW